ncbi:unnamed protein product [Ectocarpus sp. 6 AP-2014]
MTRTGRVILFWIVGGVFANVVLMVINVATFNDLPDVFEYTSNIGHGRDRCPRSICCYLIKIFTIIILFRALLVSLAASAVSLPFLLVPLPTSCEEKDTTSGGPPGKISGSKIVASSGLADHDAGASPKVLGKVEGLAGQVAEARPLRRGQHHEVCHEGFHGRPDPSRGRATRGGKAQDEFCAGGDGGD